MNETKLTSVKLLKELYDRFKLTTINTKMTLQRNLQIDQLIYISRMIISKIG